MVVKRVKEASKNAQRICVLNRLLAITCAIFIFTFFDWLVHTNIASLGVPSWYFSHKILYGTLWACLTSFFVQKMPTKKQAGIITIVTVTLLQIRYALWGYPLEFHLVVIPEHLITLFVPLHYLLKKAKATK